MIVWNAQRTMSIVALKSLEKSSCKCAAYRATLMSQASLGLWSSQISFIVMALAIDTIIYNLSRMHDKIIIATPILH